VRRNPGAIDADRVNIPTHHDLNNLAEAANYPPSREETELMTKLTTITTWSGRYPVAKTRFQHGGTGLVREAIFDDPVAAGLACQALIKSLRQLVDDPSESRPKGGAVVVWSD
jgi:hypothetical protein